jgi:hypothetical protein
MGITTAKDDDTDFEFSLVFWNFLTSNNLILIVV